MRVRVAMRRRRTLVARTSVETVETVAAEVLAVVDAVVCENVLAATLVGCA